MNSGGSFATMICNQKMARQFFEFYKNKLGRFIQIFTQLTFDDLFNSERILPEVTLCSTYVLSTQFNTDILPVELIREIINDLINKSKDQIKSNKIIASVLEYHRKFSTHSINKKIYHIIPNNP